MKIFASQRVTIAGIVVVVVVFIIGGIVIEYVC